LPVFGRSPGEAPVDLAQHLVWGAVAYARGFSCGGKPEYVQGPYDDADRILRTLDANVGRDNFHFTVQVPMQVG
jgi:hypothetical protein